MTSNKDTKEANKNKYGNAEFFESVEKMGADFTENVSKFAEQWNGQWKNDQWNEQLANWYNSWINELPESFTQNAAKPTAFNLRKNLDDIVGVIGNAALPKIDTAKILEAQFELWQNYQKLWMNTTLGLMHWFGAESEGEDKESGLEVIKPDAEDYRFKDPEWSSNPVFSFIKQSYLLNSQWLRQMVDQTEGMDDAIRMKIEFYSRMIVDAMSPTNFALTNPTVLREMKETGGQNIIQGITNFLEDQQAGFDYMRPRHTDNSTLKVGENIASAKLCGFSHWSSSTSCRSKAIRSVFSSYCCCGWCGQGKKKRQEDRSCRQYLGLHTCM